MDLILATIRENEAIVFALAVAALPLAAVADVMLSSEKAPITAEQTKEAPTLKPAFLQFEAPTAKPEPKTVKM